MANNYVQPGNTLTMTAPSGGVVSGKLYIINNAAVVALTSAAQGTEFEGAISGVFDLPKAPSQAWNQGARIMWDNTVNQRASNATTAGFFPIGIAVRAVGSGANETTGRVRLNGVSTVAL